jgi:hypothetical protein
LIVKVMKKEERNGFWKKHVGLVGVWNSSDLFQNFWFPTWNFCIWVLGFSKLRWITQLQISHGTWCKTYLSTGIKSKLFLCCMRLSNLQKAAKQRLIGVPSEAATHPRKPNLFSCRSIDRKHIFLHVQFDVELLMSFTRKSMVKKKWHFFMEDHPSFFKIGVWQLD